MTGIRRVRYSYGLYGTPTALELAARLADLKGGRHCFLAPGGQAAIALISLAFVRSGGHMLLPESTYGPNRDVADRLLARLGITTDYYDPMIGGEIRTLIRDNSQLIWCQLPRLKPKPYRGCIIGCITSNILPWQCFLPGTPRMFGWGRCAVQTVRSHHSGSA